MAQRVPRPIGGIAGASAQIAQILLYIFVVLFIVSLIAGLARRGGPPPV